MTRPAWPSPMACRPTSLALTQSALNATEGAGKLQVADGALSQVTTLLNRAVTLATESANGTVNDGSQRQALDAEFTAIKAEIDRIGSNTTYNGSAIFAGGGTNFNQVSAANTRQPAWPRRSAGRWPSRPPAALPFTPPRPPTPRWATLSTTSTAPARGWWPRWTAMGICWSPMPRTAAPRLPTNFQPTPPRAAS